MFGKLLKHEFNAQRSLFTWLSVGALGAGVVGAIVIQLLIRIFQDDMAGAGETQEGFMILGTVALMFIAMILLFAIAAYASAVGLMLIYRFYKHHFTDEGYLTFTLPATTHQILFSSVLNVLIWTVISTIVVIIGYLVMFSPLIALASREGMFSEMNYILTETFGSGVLVTQVVMIICTSLGGLILPLLSVTIGAQSVKKHKFLAGIAVYFGLNIGVSFITAIVSTFTGILDMVAMDGSGYLIITYLVQALLYLGIAVGGYFLMHRLISTKLNLT